MSATISLHLAALLFASAAHCLAEAPCIFWTSSPAQPDEAVYLQGHALTVEAAVEYARIPNSGDASILKWTKAPSLQASGVSMQFLLPADEALGAYRVRVSSGKDTAESTFNLPEVWWTQGEGGLSTAYRGGWLRVFGRALQLGQSRSQVRIEAAGETRLLTPTKPGDGYSLNFELPKDVAVGRYTVKVHNGFGGEAGWRPSGDVSVIDAPVWPSQRFDVTRYGATPNDDGDDAPGIQAALDTAGKAGGGEVFISPGRYVVSTGLKIPRRVTLKGAGRELVALQWYDYGVNPTKPPAPSYAKQGEPPLALIQGDAWFRVQDLTLFAFSHYHGVLAQHWKGEGNVHLSRVRMRLDETAVNFGRFFATKDGWADAEFREIQARRERRKGWWTAAFQAGGPNISVDECDFEDNGFGIILDNPVGAVIRNSRFYSAFSKGARAMILEDNTLHSFWPGTHDSFDDPLRRRGQSRREANPATQFLYMARNSSKETRSDREATSLDSHGPFGRYLGPIEAVQGTTLKLKALSADGQKPPKNAPVGYGVYILDGRGAGQFRRVVGGAEMRIEMDRPFDVLPDSASIVSIAKYHGELLYIDNDFTDTGDIQIWGGAVNTVFKGTKLTRTGGFNQAGGYIFGGVIPIWFLEQFDTHVIEGNSPGGPPFRVRDTRLSMNTYRHPEFYTGPCVRAVVLRRVIGENNASIDITGAVRGALVEHSLLKNNDRGIVIQSRASYYKDPELAQERRSPSDILLRANQFENIGEPFSGDEVQKFKRGP